MRLSKGDTLQRRKPWFRVRWRNSFKPELSRRSTSSWAANCVVVRKKDIAAMGFQDCRALNTLLKSDRGGLGDIQSIFDGVKGASCFASIDLASGFT